MIHCFAIAIEPKVVLSPEDAFHLFQVLRLRDRETIHLVHQGKLYLAEVVSSSAKSLRILKRLEADTELGKPMTLLLPLLKGEKLDWAIQKAVELGVHSIVLLETERTIVRWESGAIARKKQRLEKIVYEAAMQSQRLMIPLVLGPLNIAQALKKPWAQGQFIAYEIGIEGLPTLRQVSLEHHLSYAVLVGPEGGFTEAEFLLAKQNGYQPISLGNRILRSETAALSALSQLSMLIEKRSPKE